MNATTLMIIGSALFLGLCYVAWIFFARWSNEKNGRGLIRIRKRNGSGLEKIWVVNRTATDSVTFKDGTFTDKIENERTIVIRDGDIYRAKYPSKAMGITQTEIDAVDVDNSFKPISERPDDPLEDSNMLTRLINGATVKAVMRAYHEWVNEGDKAPGVKLGTILNIVTIVGLVALAAYFYYANSTLYKEVVNLRGALQASGLIK